MRDHIVTALYYAVFLPVGWVADILEDVSIGIGSWAVASAEKAFDWADR